MAGPDPPGPPVGVVGDLGGQSKWYVVVITSTRYGTVQAWLPDGIQIAVKSSWGPIVGNIESALVNWSSTLAFGGVNKTLSRRLSAQEWRGTEPLQLILPLHFFATTDAGKEVVGPIKRLIKMSLAREFGGAGPISNFLGFNLQPPGPVPFSNLQNPLLEHQIVEDIINVYIGNFIRLETMFIASLSAIEFKGKLSTDGLPMEGLCTVEFKTVFPPTSNEMDNYLGTGLGPPTGFPVTGL